MKTTTLFLLSLLIAISAEAAPVKKTPVAAPGNWEKPPVLSAKAVLPAELLKSKYHTVQDRVENDGYNNHYVVTSPYGTFKAESTEALIYRINEISAIVKLKSISSSSAFASAAKDAGIDLVTAPVKAVGKVYETVKDPEKLGDTVKAIPEGIVGLFKFAARNVQSGYEAVAGKDSSEAAEEGVEAGSSFAEDFIGYTDAVNARYEELKIDPYTDNEIVKDEVKRIARVETGVKAGVHFVPGIGGIALIGDINKYSGYASFVAEYANPAKVRGEHQVALDALGVPAEVSKRFLDNKLYTPTLRLRIIRAAQTLKNVKGEEALIRMAADGPRSGESAAYYARASELLAKQGSLRTVVTTTQIPAAVNTDNVLVLPLAVDYLVWTDLAGPLVEDTLREARAEMGAQSVRAIISGRASPRCQQELEARGVVVGATAG